jgi:hypothetical protein
MTTFANAVAQTAASSIGSPIPANTKSNKFALPPIDDMLSPQDTLLDIPDAQSRNAVLEIQAYYRAVRDDLSNTPGVYHTGETFGVEAASGNTEFYKNMLNHLAERANIAADVLKSSTHCKHLAITKFWWPTLRKGENPSAR